MTRPLRIAALVKQIPKIEALTLGDDGRLQRDGLELHMNDYCRARRWPRATSSHRPAPGGTLTVITLGPAPTENVLREAIAFGADHGVRVSDFRVRGQRHLGHGKGARHDDRRARRVRPHPRGPQLGGRRYRSGAPAGRRVPRAPLRHGAAREITLADDVLTLRLEHDDEWVDIEGRAAGDRVVAERLCGPVQDQGPRGVGHGRHAAKIRHLDAAALGAGPWGRPGITRTRRRGRPGRCRPRQRHRHRHARRADRHHGSRCSPTRTAFDLPRLRPGRRARGRRGHGRRAGGPRHGRTVPRAAHP